MRTGVRDVDSKGNSRATRGSVFMRTPRALLGALPLLSTTVAFAGTQVDENSRQPSKGYSTVAPPTSSRSRPGCGCGSDVAQLSEGYAASRPREGRRSC
jgi:hypothetical protein